MFRIILAVALSVTALLPARADDAPEPPLPVIAASEADLDALVWVARPVIVFADTPNDPRFVEQMELLLSRPEGLVARDVVIITDTDPANPSAIRRQHRPRGFMLVLVAKDGSVNLRKPAPWDVRELTRAIDKMPFRQEELRRR